MSYRDRERSSKIYVGNLSSSTTRGDLEYEFGYYGRLVNVWVAKNPPGFSYVEFEEARDAEDAIKGLDGRELHGRRIRVEQSHGMPRGRREEGGRFSRGGAARRAFHPTDRCYNCGESGHYAYDCDLYSRRSRGSERRSRRSRSRSRTPRRSRRRSPSYSRSRSRSRSYHKSASKSRSRSFSRSRSRSRKNSRSYSRSPERKKSADRRSRENGRPSTSRSRSRSH